MRLLRCRRPLSVGAPGGAHPLKKKNKKKKPPKTFGPRHTNSDTADTAKGQQTGQTHAKMFAI
ncbi:hypothetical protein JM40_25970, partial [Salmonella enterica]